MRSATGPSGAFSASASWDMGCTAPPLPAGTHPVCAGSFGTCRSLAHGPTHHPAVRHIRWRGWQCTSVGRCLRGSRVLASPSMDAPREFHGPGRCLSAQFSGSRQGSLSNVYDQVVTCAGLGGNYARSRTAANDPRELIPQPLLQWAVTTVGAKKPQAFSAPAASSASPTEPSNTIRYSTPELMNACSQHSLCSGASSATAASVYWLNCCERRFG